MQTLALVAVIAAAMQGASPSVYGPPAPSIPAMPGHRLPVPSTVQPVGGIVQQVLSDIQHGRDEGQLSRKEAKALRKEAALIGELEARYVQDGLSDSERAELRTRAELVRANTHAKRLGVIK